jgi:hypothetical protein
MKKSIAFVLLAAIFSLAGPVSYYGNLYVDGNRIKGTGGEVIQLKGPSFYWSDGIGMPFYDSKNVNWFVDTMDISVFRHAMTVQYLNSDGSTGNVGNGDGYLTNAANKAKQIALIDTMVKAAITNDIYIIIDWHSHRAQDEQSAAVEFFTNMATKYKGIPNVIFEIYNEPSMYDCSSGWNSISGYMNAVINAIRNTAQNSNLILVGSPQWSSCPNVANSSAANIAYTVHFYAGTHSIGGTQNSNSNTALTAGKAVFASEWGTTDAHGSGNVNASSSRQWMSWMNTNKISSCQWSVSNFEGSSIFKSSSSNSVALNNLSESGKLLYEFMCDNTNYNTPCKTDPPTGWPWARSRTVQGVTGNTIKEGDVKTWTKSQLEVSSGAVFHSMGTPGLSVTDDQITFTVPHELSSKTYTFNYYVKQGSKISKHRITLTEILRGPRAKIDRLNVNLRGSTTIPLSTLVEHPAASITTVNITDQSVSAGTITRASNNRSLTYTSPSDATSGQEVKLTYTVVDANGITLQKQVILVLGGTSPIRDLPLPASFGLNSHGSAISVNLAKSGAASLDVFSLTGAKIATLMSGHQNAGSYEFSLNNFAKGVYIVRLKQGSQTQTLRIVR